MANKRRLIDANAMREEWLENGENEYVYDTNAFLDSIDAQPTVDAVSMEVYKQVAWERDIAIKQLEDHGMSFGAIAPDVVSVVRCKNCKHYGWVQEPCHGRTKHICKLDEGLAVADGDDFCSYGEKREEA